MNITERRFNPIGEALAIMGLIVYYLLTKYLPERNEVPNMRAILDAQNSLYHLTFRYDPNVIIQVKSLEGRKWNPKEKEWTVPALPGVGDKLNSMGFQVEMPMGTTEIQVPKIDFDSISGFKKESLFPYQREGVEFIESRDGNALLADCMGLGKAQPLHSNILGANGWIKMGDIKLGDSIFGEDGKLHEVTGIYPQGVQKVYRVIFTDGSKCECTEDHLWNVRTPSDKYYGKGYRTLTLKQIIKSGLHLRCGTKWFIPTTKPVRFAEQSLPVDPYVMGYLLGNGHITDKAVSVSIPDKEVKEYIDNKVKRNKAYLSNTANSNDIDYRFKTTDKNSRNRMVRTLTALGLNKKSYEKFIPDRYKFSSCKQRIALLQGLMDSDGCTGGGITEYCTTSYQLMQDVKFLVHSLGGKANLSIRKNPKYIYNGEVRTGRTAYRLFIAFSNNINPFLLKRKADSFIKNTKYKITRGISKVEYVGESPCQCISTSNPTSLYLTDDLIVTHNTIQIIAWLAFRPEVRPALIVCPSSLKHNWKNEILKWTTAPCNGVIIDGKDWKTTYFGKCDPTANLDYIIINYDIIASNLEYLLKFKPKVMICDECFTAGTLIDTPNGKVPIENIKEGDEVYNAFGTGVVERTNCQEVTSDRLVTVYLDNGRRIICTENHPFFTSKGWVKSSELNIGDSLFDKSLIFDIVSNNTSSKKIGLINNAKKLRALWGEFSNARKKKTFLRATLCSEMENVPTGNKRKDKKEIDPRISIKVHERGPQTEPGFSKEIVRKNEKEQPFQKTRSYGENKEELGDKWSPINQNSKRKWTWANFTTKAFKRIIRRWVGCRTPNFYSWNFEKKVQNSRVLQGRPSSYREKDMGRSGWMDTRTRTYKEDRSEEKKCIKVIGVERHKSEKQRSHGCNEKCASGDKKVIVYNLQVSGHPSYYADDVLVHNCHYLKNDKALRTKAALKLSREIPKVICVSGTPIVNRPIEMYNAIRMVNPQLFPNKYKFGYEFCGLHKTRFGLNWNGATNTKKLHEILKSTIMIRRKKEDVLKDLPPKIHSALSLPITNGSQYAAAERDFINWVKYEKGYEKAKAAANAEALVKMNYLKQLAVEGKMPGVYEWIDNFFEESPDKKLVLFAENVFVIDKLMNHCAKYGVVKIDGSILSKERADIVEAFQIKPEIKVFVGNIRAAGVGITLTAADTVAFVQLAWTPGEMEQASDRLNRIGAKFTTNVYYLIADRTIEEDICELLDKKRAILNAVLDGKINEDSSMYRDLLDKFKERNG